MRAHRAFLPPLIAIAMATGCTARRPAAPDAGTAACADAGHRIAQIQGSAAASPLLGQVVSVSGVVASLAPGLDGVFLEAPASQRDGDAATSEGLFVALERARFPPPGEYVRLQGTVAEQGEGAGTRTALTAIGPIQRCGPLSLPEAVVLSQPPSDWESLEGMRVALLGPLVVSGNDALAAQGAVTLAFGPRLLQPTEVFVPGEEASARWRDNARRRIVLDDASVRESPPEVPWAGAMDAHHNWRAGTTLDAVRGTVDQGFGRYRIQATEPPQGVVGAARPEAPPHVGGELRIASFNVLNLMNGDGQGGGFPTARGATTEAEFLRQRAKIVAAILALAPDAAALMEIENDGYGPQGAIADLVRALNVASGSPGDYAFVAPPLPQLGGDAIAVGMIYRRGTLRPEGPARWKSDGAFGWGNRAPLAQRFVPVAGGEGFVLVANHFKSKGSCPAGPGPDSDLRDGQGCWNPTRTRAAGELAQWLAGMPDAESVLVLGDLNAHAQEDPVRSLRAAGYVDVLAAQAGSDALLYSYVFDGAAGRLDHALATPALAARVTGAAEWHVNADEAPVFDYQMQGRTEAQIAAWYRADPFRSSDHDPVVVGLRRR